MCERAQQLEDPDDEDNGRRQATASEDHRGRQN